MQVNIHRASRLALAAVHTLVPVDLIAHERDRVEQAIDRAQRAQIPAERAIDKQAQQDDSRKDQKLPGKQPASGRADARIQSRQGNPAEQHARRADILTKPWVAHAYQVDCGQRQHNDKDHQNEVLEPAQDAVAGQFFDFPWEGDLVQELLEKTEGAQPSADKAAAHRTDRKQKAEHIERKLPPAAAQDGLQRANGARAQCAWAGITVQTGHTQLFEWPAVNFALQEAAHIAVGQRGKAGLDDQPKMFHISPPQYIPGTRLPPCA